MRNPHRSAAAVEMDDLLWDESPNARDCAYRQNGEKGVPGN